MAKLPPEASEINWNILIPILYQHLDNDKLAKLDATFTNYKNGVNMTDFYTIVKNVTGDQFLQQAIQIMQTQRPIQISSSFPPHVGLPAKTPEEVPSTQTEQPSEILCTCLPISSTPLHAGCSAKTPRKRLYAQKKKPSELLDKCPPLSTTPIHASFSSKTPRKRSSALKKKSSEVQEKCPPLLTSSVHAACSTNTPSEQSSTQKRRLLEILGASPHVSSKRQKTAGTFCDQSIEEVNDAIATCGVDLTVEEQQLLSPVKEYNSASETTQRVTLEGESLFLQSAALEKKMKDIMLKCGLENITSDVPGHLSMCVEEYLWCLITCLIRLSKQRIDTEMGKHQVVITSDVRKQISILNQKAKKKHEKRIAEEAKKSEKPHEANKKEVGLKVKSANSAARAAVGGVDDVLLRWQIMAEQAKQRHECLDRASVFHPGESSITRASTLGRSYREKQPCGNEGSSSILTPRTMEFANQPVTGPPAETRRISIKDVIAVLERDPQMSKSTLMHHLYEKFGSILSYNSSMTH